MAVLKDTGKNPSLTLARDKTKKEFISKRQLSSYDLAFGVELGPNPHYRMVLEHILNSVNRSITMSFMHQAQ